MKRLLLFLFALAAFVPAKASFSHNTQITHTGLKPVPNSFQLAKSHFLPDYQEGNFTFDKGDDISAACPASIYKYTKNNCSYPNIPQSVCGGKYRVCGCERVFAYSAAQCAATGKEGGGESCTVRGGSDDGTTYYTSCVCPSSYTKLSDGQICTGTECSSAGERYCDRFENIQCTGAYMLCNNNQTGEGGFCNDKEGNKYTGCYCDEDIYPETDESCRYHYGTNAVGSGTSCNNGERWRSCSCDASCPASHPDKSCGSLGISDETDDGCGGKCYKCNSCSPTCQNETNCSNGTKIVDNGCGGECTICKKGPPAEAIIFTFSPDTANVTLTLPTAAYSGITANYTVDWGDGTIDKNLTTFSPTHTYAEAGSYDVTITGILGQLGSMFTQYNGNQRRITQIKQLNLSSIKSFRATFYDERNITGTIPELPKGLISASGMFSGCSSLTGNIPELPSGMTDGETMFTDCWRLSGSIPELPSELTNGNMMFENCSGLTGEFPELPNKLTKGFWMFYGCRGLIGNIPKLPSGLTDGRGMFYQCNNLTGVTPINGQYPYQYLTKLNAFGNMVAECSDAVRQHFPTSWGGTCTTCQ